MEILDPRFRGDDEGAVNGANLPLSGSLLGVGRLWTVPECGGKRSGLRSHDE